MQQFRPIVDRGLDRYVDGDSVNLDRLDREADDLIPWKRVVRAHSRPWPGRAAYGDPESEGGRRPIHGPGIDDVWISQIQKNIDLEARARGNECFEAQTTEGLRAVCLAFRDHIKKMREQRRPISLAFKILAVRCWSIFWGDVLSTSSIAAQLGLPEDFVAKHCFTGARCSGCGEPLRGKQVSYCGSACKQKAHRSRRRMIESVAS